MIELKGAKFTVSDDGMVKMQRKYHADTELAALTEIPNKYNGLIRRGHNGGQWDAGADEWIVTATYEGQLEDGSDNPELDQFEIVPEFREEKIENFPDRQALVDQFGAFVEDGKLKFPEALPTRAAGTATGLIGATVAGAAGFGAAGIGLSAAQSALQAKNFEKNPLFGLTTYPVEYEVATHTFVRSQVPASAHRLKNTVITDLPAGFEYAGDTDAWFVTAPRIVKVGSAKRIVQRYKELPPVMKHIEALYLILSEA